MNTTAAITLIILSGPNNASPGTMETLQIYRNNDDPQDIERSGTIDHGNKLSFPKFQGNAET